jgi:hypothetical protein
LYFFLLGWRRRRAYLFRLCTFSSSRMKVQKTRRRRERNKEEIKLCLLYESYYKKKKKRKDEVRERGLS